MRSIRNRVAKGVRSEPWRTPKLGGGNGTRQILSGHESSVRADYEAGMGSVALLRKYGVPVNTMLDWLRREGVEIRSGGEALDRGHGQSQAAAFGWLESPADCGSVRGKSVGCVDSVDPHASMTGTPYLRIEFEARTEQSPATSAVRCLASRLRFGSARRHSADSRSEQAVRAMVHRHAGSPKASPDVCDVPPLA